MFIRELSERQESPAEPISSGLLIARYNFGLDEELFRSAALRELAHARYLERAACVTKLAN